MGDSKIMAGFCKIENNAGFLIALSLIVIAKPNKRGDNYE